MYQYKEKAVFDQIPERERNGIPVQLRKKVEQNTAVKLDDVKIHYNSDRPARLDALAYTRGTQIYLGPGQEGHLPHELGHVVQQKLGLVRPDTRHESGVLMNTDPALERQADRIGAGRERAFQYAGTPSGEPAVQRMAVFEGMEGDRPRIARYKRNGWRAVQELKRFFTEESIQRASMMELANVSRDTAIPKQHAEAYTAGLKQAAEAQEVFQYTTDFEATLLGCIEKLQDAVGPPLGIWNRAGDEFGEALQKCQELLREEGIPMEDATMTRTPMTELEGRGAYQREAGEIDPYEYYKKQALYCIAQKASTIDHDASSVGPHIAIMVMGKRIYIANNTHFSGKALQADMGTLMKRVREAINGMRGEDIEPIMRNEDGHGVRHVPFELRQGGVPSPPTDRIMEWIEKIRSYPISVVDAPRYRENTSYEASPIHGEMTIMDYMKNHKELFTDRGNKLQQAGAGVNARRVLWIGGTRVDCIRCHEHFDEINAFNDGLAGNQVVSSQHVGTVGSAGEPFPGTEDGTSVDSKHNDGNLARIWFREKTTRNPKKGQNIPPVPPEELQARWAQVVRDTDTGIVEGEDERSGILLRDMDIVLQRLEWERTRKESGRPYAETGVLEWAVRFREEFEGRMTELQEEDQELAGMFVPIFQEKCERIDELLSRISPRQVQVQGQG